MPPPPASSSSSFFPAVTSAPPASASAASSRSNPSSVSADDLRRSRRRERGALRDALNRVSSMRRFRECGWPDRLSRPAEIAARKGVASWRRVKRCGSIHSCAVCAATIRNYRAVEVNRGAAAWINAGNEVYMLTFTARHVSVMALAALLNLISAAFRSVIRGRPWRRLCDELGIVGHVRSLEVTQSGLNGWHPHLHVLLFVEGMLDASGLEQLHRYFKGTRMGGVETPGAWGRFIESVCRDCGKQKVRNVRAKDPCVCGGPAYDAPSYQHGVHIERCYSAEDAANYICKTQETHKNVGAEMVRADMKTASGEHRVPFEILASAGEGNEADLRLWHEFERATKGRKAITWSRGLRAIVSPPVRRDVPVEDWLVELTDEEIVRLEPTFSDESGDHVEPGGSRLPEADTVARVSALGMRHGRRIPGFRVALQEAFEDGGTDRLAEVARGMGLEVRWVRGGLVPLIVPPLWPRGIP